MHLILRSDPPFAFALEEGRNAIFDRRDAEDDRRPRAIEDGAFGHAMKTGDHFDGAMRVERA